MKKTLLTLIIAIVGYCSYAQTISSATPPILYNSSTGVISSQPATTSQDGHLTSTDWNIFNNKQPALTFSIGLTNIGNTITVNIAQHITALSNLTADGLIKTSGGTGTLSIATAGTDYQLPITSGAGTTSGSVFSLGKNIALNGGTPNPWYANKNSIDIDAANGMAIWSGEALKDIYMLKNAYVPAAGNILVRKNNGFATALGLSNTGSFSFRFTNYGAAGTSTGARNPFIVDSLGNETLAGSLTSQTPIGTAGTDSIVVKIGSTKKYGAIAANYYANANLTGDVTSVGNVSTYNNVVPAIKGGAGAVNGLLKADGSGTVSAAVSNTDYLPVTSPVMVTPALGVASATSLNITGATAATPSTGVNMFASANRLSWVGTNGFPITLRTLSLTAGHSQSFPDVDGTFYAGSLSVGSIPYATSTAATASLAIGSTGNILGVVSGLPAWVNYDADIRTLTNKSIDGLTNTLTNITATTNANLTGPITSVGNATSVASQTGTGSKFVMDTSPVLITPTSNYLLLTGAISSATTPTGSNVVIGRGVIPNTFSFKGASGFSATIGTGNLTSSIAYALPANTGTFYASILNTGTMPYAVNSLRTTGLAIGSSGDILTVSAGIPAWVSGSSSYIKNQTSQQASSNFNISGTGVVGGDFTALGNVAIGTTDPKGYKLAVNGSAIATSMTVKLYGNWPDYVFNKDYLLPSLSEVKNYIDQNQHLPEMPTEREIKDNGINLGEMNKLLVKKVEELTLYAIDQQQQIEQLKQQTEARIIALEKALSKLTANK